MTDSAARRLPAQRLDAQGHAHVDLRAVLTLAWPLILNSTTHIALNLTDTWYIGRLSTDALAGMGSIYWLVIVFIGLLGGVGMAVQTVVAQAFGAGRYKRAAQATWTAVWASLATAPVFFLLGFNGDVLLKPFGLADNITHLALGFWEPRMLGAPIGVTLWALLGFFNGVGRTRVTLVINLMTLLLNAVLAPIFMFVFHWGMAGAAWATNCAMALGVATALYTLTRSPEFVRYRPLLMWRLRGHRLLEQFKLGLPMGLMLAADLFGFALFQLMQVRLSAVDGAATQVVTILTSIAYMPAIGIGIAGTTLVGQSIGRGDKAWARRLGNAVILLATGYMGGVGLLLGVFGPWLMPLFIPASDPNATIVISTGITLLWLAGAYQLFDGMLQGSNFCLRGAGDVAFPAVIVTCTSWLVFVPLAHSLSFAPGEGYVDFLPQYGLGTVGGWCAAVLYMGMNGILMFLRWRSNAWQRMQVS